LFPFNGSRIASRATSTFFFCVSFESAGMVRGDAPGRVEVGREGGVRRVDTTRIDPARATLLVDLAALRTGVSNRVNIGVGRL
jgi:hypothetical protein